MALSDDLRKRVVEAVVVGGLSRNAAARCFGVSIASAVRWVTRYKTTGQISPSPLVPYGLTRDIFCANWRCGKRIFWHNGPAVMAWNPMGSYPCTRVGGNNLGGCQSAYHPKLPGQPRVVVAQTPDAFL